MGLIISISGAPGSGKSSIGRALSQKLHIPFFSMGDIRREYGMERGLTIAALNSLSEGDSTSDRLVDEYQAKLPEKYSSFVIDSRLGYHFIPSSFKIFIDVEQKVGARRIFENLREEERWSSVEQGVLALEERVRSDTLRYRHLYGIVWNDLSLFDLVLDSSHTSIEHMAQEIIGELRRRGIHV